MEEHEKAKSTSDGAEEEHDDFGDLGSNRPEKKCMRDGKKLLAGRYEENPLSHCI
jgi:hypothetical protein